MKTIILSLFCLFGISSPLFSQNKTAKIYFLCHPSGALLTMANPDKPIKINNCTLLETDLDSVGLEVSKEMKVYLHFEPGRIYYYHKVLTNPSGNVGTAVLSECTEQEFWLNAYFIGAGMYRHYFLNKQSGLKLLEEKYR